MYYLFLNTIRSEVKIDKKQICYGYMDLILRVKKVLELGCIPMECLERTAYDTYKKICLDDIIIAGRDYSTDNYKF